MKLKRGDYLRKKNYTCIFGKGVPVIKVKSIDGKSGIINGIPNTHIHNSSVFKTLVVISEEEAIQLMEEWNNTLISNIPVKKTEFVHVREDTGKTKESIGVFHIKEVLFHYKKTKSEKFDAYKCPVCNQYHLGKIKS